ncbi:hypothetical protein DFQ26_009945, partial [Actinomortierella ambigua]
SHFKFDACGKKTRSENMFSTSSNPGNAKPNVPDIYPGLTTNGRRLVNDAVFVVLVDSDVVVTFRNISALNPRNVARPILY